MSREILLIYLSSPSEFQTWEQGEFSDFSPPIQLLIKPLEQTIKFLKKKKKKNRF